MIYVKYAFIIILRDDFFLGVVLDESLRQMEAFTETLLFLLLIPILRLQFVPFKGFANRNTTPHHLTLPSLCV